MALRMLPNHTMRDTVEETASPYPFQGEDPRLRSRVLVLEPVTPLSRHLADLIDESEELEVCGAVSTMQEAIDAIPTLSPDLVLVGSSLKPRHVLAAVRELSAFAPDLKSVVLSGRHSPSYANQILLAGADGYASLEDLEQLADAIQDVLAGALFVSEDVSCGCVPLSKGHTESQEATALPHLTDGTLPAFPVHCPA